MLNSSLALVKSGSIGLNGCKIGLLMFNDNSYYFRFLFGFLTSFVVLPHVNFSEEDRIAKLVVQIACGVLSVVLFALLFIVFYLAQVIEISRIRFSSEVYSFYPHLKFNSVRLTRSFCIRDLPVKTAFTSTVFPSLIASVKIPPWNSDPG